MQVLKRACEVGHLDRPSLSHWASETSCFSSNSSMDELKERESVSGCRGFVRMTFAFCMDLITLLVLNCEMKIQNYHNLNN